MNGPDDATLPSWLAERLPPGEADFAAIAGAFIAHPARARFLLTVNSLEKDVDVHAKSGGNTTTRRETFKKLAETLLLFEDALLQVFPAARVRTVRSAYQHYIINTDGPIPLRPEATDFDVFAWATEYAHAFNIKLEQTADADGKPETLMTIDDPGSPVRCAAWGPAEGRSSAWSLREVGQLINYRRYGRNDVVPSRLFAFDAHASIHSKANALWLADVSQLVYLKEGYVRAQLEQRGYAQVRWIENAATDTQAVVAGGDEHALVVFRGTAGGQDILTDLIFRKVPFIAGADNAPAVGEVHRGFAAALDSVWAQVLAAVQAMGPHKPLFVSGHSLGAALAQLAAMRLAEHGLDVAGVYVYGSPRVGNASFRDAYDAALGARTFLHINHEDVVARVPPRWIGFDHVAQPARRFDAGHRISIEDMESRSPAAAPQGSEPGATARELMLQAANAVRDTNHHLTVSDLTALTTGGMTYSAQFEEGRLDDHGIAQYLFKFACSMIEDRMATLAGDDGKSP